jgi:serine/threonine protein kinase
MAAMATEAQPLCQQDQFEKKYVMEDKSVGEGTYGCVYKARCSQTGRVVAIKKMKPEHEDEGVPSTAIREVAVLKETDHPNVVKLLDVYCVRRKVHLVFEFIDRNLKEHMRQHNMQLTPGAVRCFHTQMLRGILFLHTHRILHRDLKPQNVLIDSTLPAVSLRTLKLADFGMARAFSLPIPKYTHEVVTIWYRAPEILFGTQEYALPVDMWSAGCILAEMATGSALFRGDSEIDTIFRIFRRLGTPSEQEWPGLSSLPDFKMTFPKWTKTPWADVPHVVPQLGPHGVAVLDELLRYDPRRRMSARQALAHQYSSDLDVAMDG